MKYVSLAAHNNELIVINDMDAFTAHFCYSKKQRQGKIETPIPAMIGTDDAGITIPPLEVEEEEAMDEDDL